MKDRRTDAELVAAVLGEDRESFRPLVERYQKGLIRYAVRIVSNLDAAEDMVQDTLVAAYEKLASCQEPERFGAWCFRILRNRCRDYLRSPEHRSMGSDALLTTETELGDPVRDTERSIIRSDVSRALASLPPLLREAFVLFHLESLSYPEMADRLDASRSALKMRVKRAREALQAALDDCEDRAK
jgi:RNA polymerase sigma-70 factor, ECF subfamily